MRLYPQKYPIPSNDPRHSLPAQGSSSSHSSHPPGEQALHPPHRSTGTPREHVAVVLQSESELANLRRSSAHEENRNSSDPRMLPQKIRALRGRIAANQILADDSQEDLKAKKTAAKFKRIKNRRLKKAALHEGLAAADARNAKYQTRLENTIRETRPEYQKELKAIAKRIQALKYREHTNMMFARYWEDRAYGTDNSSAGGYHQTPVGNYMDEYPTRGRTINTLMRATKITRSPGFDSLPRANKEHIGPEITATRNSNKATIKEQKISSTPEVEAELFRPPDTKEAKASIKEPEL